MGARMEFWLRRDVDGSKEVAVLTSAHETVGMPHYHRTLSGAHGEMMACQKRTQPARCRPFVSTYV